MIERLPVEFSADHKKVALLYFELGAERITSLVQRISRMDKKLSQDIWLKTYMLFKDRHRNYELIIDQHAQQALSEIEESYDLNHIQKKLLGAYLTKEYSTQSAALFNPTIVEHPDQKESEVGSLKIILCLRATGEGHISSISIREGMITAKGQIQIQQDTQWQSLGHVERSDLNKDVYSVEFEDIIPLQERILFPVSESEIMGMEDLRLVDFGNEQFHRYVGTFTAYNGRNIQSKILFTNDFQNFEIRPLSGTAINGKGIAFFPRKIRGKYMAIGRQDGVNMTIMSSDNLTDWNNQKLLQSPQHPFEFTQLGNCGSPLETPEGWLLITHAVGPMRRYVLSATLLDLDKPHKVIGILRHPLLEPNEKEREGYVPNVLYSCGSIIFKNNIYLPYAYSDQGCNFGKVKVKDLLTELKYNS